MTAQEGQVFDLGYRRYEGPREGRARARKALFVNGVRTCFGLGRGAWAKVLPILFLLAVMAPAAVLAALAGLLGDTFMDVLDLPGPADYYGIVWVILMLFSATIAPELLCPDRRDGVINLYLVRPLSAEDYILSRWLSFFAVSLVFIYAGQALLLTGLALGAGGATDIAPGIASPAGSPTDYLRDNWLDIPRSLASGLAIAAVTTTIPLAAASLTTRRAYAALAVIALFLTSLTVSGILLGEVDQVGSWARLIDFGGITLQVNDLIFDQYDDGDSRLPPVVAVAWWAVVVAVPAFILWWRYRRLVT